MLREKKIVIVNLIIIKKLILCLDALIDTNKYYFSG